MSKKILFILAVFFFCVSLVNAQSNAGWMKAYMLKTVNPVIIDGELNEWNFCFPLDMNLTSIPETYNGVPATLRTVDSDEDCSGTFRFMWDEENLYFSVFVKDDMPGMAPTITSWAADAIEFYFGNYDLGDNPHAPSDEVHEGGAYYDNPELGLMDCHFQLNISKDPADVHFVWYQPWEGNQEFPDSQSVVFDDDMVEVVFLDQDDDGNDDAYIVEGKLPLNLLVSPKGTQFGFLEEDAFIPFTCGIFDVDTDDAEQAGADFQALRYGINHPGVDGVHKWPISLQVAGVYHDVVAFEFPYAKKATDPVILDGMLNEWNFCFPYDMNLTSIPEEYDGTPATLRTVDSDEDCSGTMKFMWDEEYLYFSAHVADDVPGMAPAISTWSSDALEFYFGNYDIGDALHAPDDEVHSGGAYYDNPELGLMDCHFQYNLDQPSEDHYFVWYQPWEGNQDLPDSQSVVFPDEYSVVEYWENGMGYTVEGRLPWSALVSPLGTNFGIPEEDTRVPFTCGIFDVDTDDAEQAGADFQALRMGTSHPGVGGVQNWAAHMTFVDFNPVQTPVSETKVREIKKHSLIASNYPNPFNPETVIEFQLKKANKVTIEVFDITGKLVEKIASKNYSAGTHQVKWQAADYATGLYFYKVEAGNESVIGKMTLLK